jgi:hypothetical protein
VRCAARGARPLAAVAPPASLSGHRTPHASSFRADGS